MVPPFLVVRKQDPKKIVMLARIPAFPAALKKVLDATNNPATTSAELEELILKSPALCVQILKVVNSSYYSLAQRVTSLNQAVILLGFSTIKSMAASLIMLESLGSLKGVSKKFFEAVWQRSVACGAMIRLFEKETSPEVQQRLFLAGLSHDMGHLVLCSQFRDQYEALRQEELFPDPKKEEKKIGVQHPDVGAVLLERWGFDSQLVELVRQSHSDEAKDLVEKEIKILKLGDMLAELPRFGKSFQEVENLPEFNEIKKLAQEVGWSMADILKEEKRIFSDNDLGDVGEL